MIHLYLDTSALTKLVLDEPGSSDLERLVRNRSLVTSRVAVVEVAKAIDRVSPKADARAVFDLVSFVEFDDEIASVASAIGGPPLRALDAVHVATAIRLGPELESFVTYDERQGVAARAAGLDVRTRGRLTA